MAAVSSSFSEVRGAAISVVVSSFFSRLSSMSVASLSSRWATKRCSWSLSRPFCLSMSAWIVPSFSSILAMSPSIALSAAAVFASFCRLSSRFLVAVSTVCAACCALPAFSQAPFISSAAISRSEDAKALVASAAAATLASTSTTFSATSRLTVASFRSTIPFLVSLSFLAAASTRACSSPSCAVAAFMDISDSRFAARRFMARKVFAPPTAVWAPETADSSSASALLASSTWSSSALLKGSSASTTFFRLSSASLTLASDSFTRPSTASFSDRSRIMRMFSSSFSCDAFTSGCSFAISSLARPWDRDCASRNLLSVFSATCASAAACSAALTGLLGGVFCSASASLAGSSLASPSFLPSSCSSLPSFSPSLPSFSSLLSSFLSSSRPSASTSSTTLATFSSVAFSFACASSTDFLAASRSSTVDESFLNLPTSAWAELSLAWYLISSELTSDEASLPLASICLAVMNFLASLSAAFASCSALTVSSEAARISLEVSCRSFESSSKRAPARATFLESSSAFVTSVSTSRMVASFFLPAVAFLRSVNFLV
mmetsp:Transcript_3530/g.10274  ORF Transcript_3530/g.10274 Transcript_3530/m.10274 type:complete len:549 (-) Transcript_3530:1736-3382(-)